jgi:hypothetical protein
VDSRYKTPNEGDPKIGFNKYLFLLLDRCGYLPVAGEAFYGKASALCSVDLVSAPQKLSQPHAAAKVLFSGLRAGIFTGAR